MSLSYSIRYIHSKALAQVLVVHFFLYVDIWGVFVAVCVVMEIAGMHNQERNTPWCFFSRRKTKGTLQHNLLKTNLFRFNRSLAF